MHSMHILSKLKVWMLRVTATYYYIHRSRFHHTTASFSTARDTPTMVVQPTHKSMHIKAR